LFTDEPLEPSLVAHVFACRAGDSLWCKRSRFHPWFGRILWRRKWQPTPVFLPGESHGQRSWQAIVHGVTKNQTRLKGLSTHACKEGTPGTMINISGRLAFKDYICPKKDIRTDSSFTGQKIVRTARQVISPGLGKKYQLYKCWS